MGKDKFENENLLKYGFPEDVWFHVDDLSSAHVYLRLKPEETIENFSEKVREECCQLVKNNSIEGVKKDSVKIVYTGFLNLKKSGDMDIGMVGFVDDKKLFFVKDVRRDKIILNKILKTKEEKYPNLEQMKEDRMLDEKRDKINLYKKKIVEEKEVIKKRKEEAEYNSYASVMKKENMVSNKDASVEEDFM